MPDSSALRYAATSPTIYFPRAFGRTPPAAFLASRPARAYRLASPSGRGRKARPPSAATAGRVRGLIARALLAAFAALLAVLAGGADPTAHGWSVT